jgi:hypothetical protein
LVCGCRKLASDPIPAESGAGDEVIMSIAGHVSCAMLSCYSHVRIEARRIATSRHGVGAPEGATAAHSNLLPMAPNGVISQNGTSSPRGHFNESALDVLVATIDLRCAKLQRVTGRHEQDSDKFPDGRTTCGDS